MIVSDGRSARDELWRRYDAGALSTAELDARLKAVDRAGDTDALLTAVDGPIAFPSGRRTAIGVAVGILVLALVAGPLLLGRGSGNAETRTTGVGGPVIPVFPVEPGPHPDPECPELEEFLGRLDASGRDVPAANPALLSDPPALPEGYRLEDQEDLEAGTDPDVALSLVAGTPPPVEVRARTLSGELAVSMRGFGYASAEEAIAAGRSVAAQGVCAVGLVPFDIPERPELVGSVVSGPIPTTAFVSFRLADRRVSVSVAASVDGDVAATEAARLLAGTVAALELDAARAAPADG